MSEFLTYESADSISSDKNLTSRFFDRIIKFWNDHNFGIRKWDIVRAGSIFSDSFSVGIHSASSSYSIGNGDSVVFVDSTAGPVTITLPTTIGIIGRVLFIKRINGGKNMVTIATSLAQTIDGGSVYYLPAQYHSVSLVSDGANWAILF